MPDDEGGPDRAEKLRRGDYVKVYVVDVHKSTRGPVIKISRTHRNLLRRLMEMEIPEVRDGIVEIKSIAREPGARSKAAVVATVPGVDPVGSCVGMRGLRIQNIVNELAGEKIDVIEWNSDSATYIQNALSPAKVQTVLLDDGSPIKTATVIVPDRQLSLAIGKEGQNARLAAKLTGWRIDIKSESEARDEGIDRVIMERAQQAAVKATEDLLAKAERILRREDEGADDKLWQAAQALRDTEPLAANARTCCRSTSSPSKNWCRASRKHRRPRALAKPHSRTRKESRLPRRPKSTQPGRRLKPRRPWHLFPNRPSRPRRSPRHRPTRHCPR